MPQSSAQWYDCPAVLQGRTQWGRGSPESAVAGGPPVPEYNAWRVRGVTVPESVCRVLPSYSLGGDGTGFSSVGVQGAAGQESSGAGVQDVAEWESPSARVQGSEGPDFPCQSVGRVQARVLACGSPGCCGAGVVGISMVGVPLCWSPVLSGSWVLSSCSPGHGKVWVLW